MIRLLSMLRLGHKAKTISILSDKETTSNLALATAVATSRYTPPRVIISPAALEY